MSFICRNILFIIAVCFISCELAHKCIDLAGKELFMKDHSLDDSDVKFLEEGTVAILKLLPVLCIICNQNCIPVLYWADYSTVIYKT